MSSLRHTAAWQALEENAEVLRETHLRDLFAGDPERGERLTVEAEGIFLDYSKNRITGETLRLLFELAEERGVASAETRCSRARRSTSPSTGPFCTSRCA